MPRFQYFLITLLILVVNFTLSAQREVAILKAPFNESAERSEESTSDVRSLPFLMDRNQILLSAAVENEEGYFLLDTGAPTLLINSRGQTLNKQPHGLGSGGTVDLKAHRVKSFSFAGVELGAQDAYLLNLSSFEARSGRQLLGMIGHEQLRNFELLIDCRKQEISLYPSGKNALHREVHPSFSVSFVYDDHLPIIILRNGRKKLRFAVDTGAGVNMIDQSISERKLADLRWLEEVVNVEGLDGKAADHRYCNLTELELEGQSIGKTDFVLTDLSHLQVPGERPIDGIIGTDFLKNYRVSIDFKKRKLHFW